MGKVLVDRLKYPLAGFSETIDAQGAIEEFGNLMDAMRMKQQDIEISVQRFQQALQNRSSRSDEAAEPVEKYVISETPLLVEVEVFEEEIPVEFANEKMEGREREATVRNIQNLNSDSKRLIKLTLLCYLPP